MRSGFLAPMNAQETDHHVQVPEIIRIVICQLVKLRHEGALPTAAFEEKIARLTREEVHPRGMELAIRELADGHIRFLFKETKSGRVRGMLDCGPGGSARGGEEPG